MEQQELTKEKVNSLQQVLQNRVNVLLKSFVNNECKKYSSNPGIWLLVVDVLGTNFCNSLAIAGEFLDEIELFDQMVDDMRKSIIDNKQKKLASSN